MTAVRTGESVEPTTECLFCQQDDPTTNRIIAENNTCFVRWDNFPATAWHVEVVPKRHVESYFDLTDDEVADAQELLRHMANLIGNDIHPDGYTIGVNEGRAAGRSIDHVHIHLAPRHFGDVPDPRGGIRRVLPNGDPDKWIPPSMVPQYEVGPKEKPRHIGEVAAIRSLSRTAGRTVQVDLTDAADVDLVYNTSVTLAHLQVTNLIDASSTLGIDNTEFLGLARRWVALLEQTVPGESS